MGEISEALARAREKTDATREEALAQQRKEGATGTRPPVLSPSAAGLVTPRSNENAARDRSMPMTLDQLREDKLRTEGKRGAGQGAMPADLTDEKKAEFARAKADGTRARRRPVHPVPRLPDEGWISRLCAVYPESPAAVRFRHLAVRIRSMLDDLPLKSLLVTSAVAGEGKTTVSVNTALALASIAPESRIALIDLDLRRGRIGGVFEHKSKIGIEHVLAGEVELEEACVETDIPAFDFYPLGHSIPDAHRLLGGSASRVLTELHARYDYLVCDGPPVLPVPDIPLLAPQLGGCLAVVASGRSKHAQFTELLELVPRSSMLGVFLNESPSATGDGKYKYYTPEEPVAASSKQAPSDKSKASAAEIKGAAAKPTTNSMKADQTARPAKKVKSKKAGGEPV